MISGMVRVVKKKYKYQFILTCKAARQPLLDTIRTGSPSLADGGNCSPCSVSTLLDCIHLHLHIFTATINSRYFNSYTA